MAMSAQNAIPSASGKCPPMRTTASRPLRALENFPISGLRPRRISSRPPSSSRRRRPRRTRRSDGSTRASPRPSSRPPTKCWRGAARPVRRGRLPGRRRHVAQHERERGAGQPRGRDPGRRARRVHARAPERPRQHGTVHERRVPDGHAPRAVDDDSARSSARRGRWRRRSSARPRSSRTCSRWGARTCRTRCRSRSGRSSAGGRPAWRAEPTMWSARQRSCWS